MTGYSISNDCSFTGAEFRALLLEYHTTLLKYVSMNSPCFYVIGISHYQVTFQWKSYEIHMKLLNSQ